MTPKERVEVELKELTEKTEKLIVFIGSDKFNNLSKVQQELLFKQQVAMSEYARILETRLERWDR